MIYHVFKSRQGFGMTIGTIETIFLMGIRLILDNRNFGIPSKAKIVKNHLV